MRNKHKYSVFSESQYIRSFPNFHYLATQKNLIPVLSLHYIWKNSSEWLLIPKNFEGYKALITFTREQEIAQKDWSHIIKIFFSGDVDSHPWGDQEEYYLANSDSEKGIYIRENLFLNKSDYDIFSLISSLKRESLYESELELNSHLKQNYLIQDDFSLESNKHWIKNLLKILKSCECYSLSYKKSLVSPSSSIKNNREKEEIIDFCNSQLSKYLKSIENKSQYFQRLQREIELFDLHDYWDYLFIFFKLLQYIKEKDVLTSAGRGSASSSLIIFLIGISQVDPLKYGLLLDRFLNISSERVPDLDLDIEGSRKQELLDYLRNQFGKENFAIPLIQKKIKKINLINTSLIKSVPNYQTTLGRDLLNKLINLPYLYQPHPSSLIHWNSNKSIPLTLTNEYKLSFPVVQLEYNLSSYLSLRKFDLLSSPYLDFISEILKKIRKSRQIIVKFTEIDLQDKKTFDLIASGATYYLFHLDNVLIKNLLKDFQPNSISDLAQLISVIRPGINKHIPKFLRYESYKKQFTNPKINEILFETRGIILFQEQIMSIISLVLDIPLYQTDKYRIALQKQDLNKIKSLEKEFLRSIDQVYAKQEGERIWEFIKSFGKYSFNKAHAVGYALSAYQAAYLKSNFTKEFFLTLIEKEGINEYILRDLRKMEYSIEIPSLLNKVDFVGRLHEKEKIFQIGLNVLKNMNNDLAFRVNSIIVQIIENNKEKNLKDTLFLLLEKKFSKEEILSLNYLNCFREIFDSGESQLFLHYNLEVFWNEWLFGLSHDSDSIKKSFTPEEMTTFEKKQSEYLRVDWKNLSLFK